MSPQPTAAQMDNPEDRSPPNQASAPAERHLFHLEGEYWTVVFAGASLRFRDKRGLRHLAVLLQRPHERIAAIELERLQPPDPAPDAVETAASARERARVNVTRAIRAALRRIEAHAPALAAHLEATIHTGAFCRYNPDPRAPIVWDVRSGR